MNQFAFFLSFSCLFCSMQLALAQSSYTMADFDRVEKIDAHMHLHNDESRAFMKQARKDKFKVLSINVDYHDFPPLSQQQKAAIVLHKTYPQDYAFIATFSMQGFGQAGWVDQTLRSLDQAVTDGALGIKIWKNVGMGALDQDGKLVMIDDIRLDPIIDFAMRNQLVVLGHQGEPKNCWLPLAEMTVNNDREYFKSHPQYHMYLHPESVSYEQQMAARDTMVARHPNMRFVGVHLASLEWSVDELARFLDRFPWANVDISARIEQLQHQSGLDREKVRQFFIKYQDRIMYGSDLAQSAEQTDRQFASETHLTWRKDWRYFNTNLRFKVVGMKQPVQGLALPKEVVDKIYRVNAQTEYPLAWHLAAKN